MTSRDITRTQARLERLRTLTRQAELDAVAFVVGANLTYLTGVVFHVSSRPLVAIIPVEGEFTFILPALEVPMVADRKPFPMTLISYTDAEGYLPAFEKVCTALKLAGKRIGVEGMKMRVLEGQLIQRYAPGSSIIPAEDALMALRLYKDQDEIAAMREAIRISEKALDSMLPTVHPGMTERQIANLLLNAMSEGGGDGNAFEPIVLTGPNTAQPHGSPGDRTLRDGELLLFDFGTTRHGYPADITRTFAVGKFDPELARIYDIVLAANQAGISAARPGATAQDVDHAAREVIAKAGYGDYFLHRTGHGLGLDVHEPPYIRDGNSQVLEPGMVFTVEPGIYLQGRGGVRIEDNVVITASGADVLTSYPKTLRTLGG